MSHDGTRVLIANELCKFAPLICGHIDDCLNACASALNYRPACELSDSMSVVGGVTDSSFRDADAVRCSSWARPSCCSNVLGFISGMSKFSALWPV